MSDEEDRGRVVSDRAMDSRNGFARQGITILRGSPGVDRFRGTQGDDLIISGGTRRNPGDIANPENPEIISGGAGSNIAILPGRREEYVARVPNLGEYDSPSSQSYQGRSTLYGSTIILSRTDENGGEQTFHIKDVGRVGFDSTGGSYYDRNREPISHIRDGIAAGMIEMHSMDELRASAESGMSHEERRHARLAGTIEAARVVDELGLRVTRERIAEVTPRAMETAGQAHPGIMEQAVQSPATGGRIDQLLGLEQAPPAAGPRAARPTQDVLRPN